MNQSMLGVCIVSLGVIVHTACVARPSPAREPENRAPQEADEQRQLIVCLAAAADYSPVYPIQSFPSPTRMVHTVFALGKDEAVAKLTAAYIAVDVGEAAPANFRITTAELNLSGKRRGVFRYSQPGDLPPGKYRIDVAADGKPWKSAEFQIVGGKAASLPDGDQLYPLTPGRRLIYQFVMQGGPGVTVRLPGVEPDAEGTLRAEVTVTAQAADERGNHLELRRNDQLVYEEWLSWTGEGLMSRRRKVVGDVFDLDPPQLLLKRGDVPATWDYQSKDGSIRQTYRIWGPLPVDTPAGKSPGYVVLVEELTGPQRVTVERHYVSTIGLVREVAITAVGENLVTRQEMSLPPVP